MGLAVGARLGRRHRGDAGGNDRRRHRVATVAMRAPRSRTAPIQPHCEHHHAEAPLAIVTQMLAGSRAIGLPSRQPSPTKGPTTSTERPSLPQCSIAFTSAGDDLDQRHPPLLPRLFREGGTCARAVRAAGPAQRPDADVRQRRHGAVQERLHRPRNAGRTAPRSAARNASAPAASTTTSTMSATPRATTPSSRCSAISRSAIISRTRRSPTPGPC